MKIKLSQIDIKDLLCKVYGLPGSIEIEIEGPVTPQLNSNLYTLITKCIRDIKALNYLSSQKIAAIKRVRELTDDKDSNLTKGYGLAEAKWVVENFEVWTEWVQTNSKFPTLTQKFVEQDNGLPSYGAFTMM